MNNLSKEQAEKLAKLDRSYIAKCIKGKWYVWCKKSDHVVEFNHE